MEMHEYFSGETITVAIEVSVSTGSRHALKWDLDKFVPGGQNLFRILHSLSMVPKVYSSIYSMSLCCCIFSE